MWTNIVQPNRTQMTVWRIACWIPKETDAHSEYVILVFFCHCYNSCIKTLKFTLHVQVTKLNIWFRKRAVVDAAMKLLFPYSGNILTI